MEASKKSQHLSKGSVQSVPDTATHIKVEPVREMAHTSPRPGQAKQRPGSARRRTYLVTVCGSIPASLAHTVSSIHASAVMQARQSVTGSMAVRLIRSSDGRSAGNPASERVRA